LHVDHENARFLAEELAELPGVKVDAAKVVTNIVIVDVSATGMTSFQISERLAQRGVLANGMSAETMRMVTHYDVDRAACKRALLAVREVVGAPPKAVFA